jgi:hypothetical protein
MITRIFLVICLVALTYFSNAQKNKRVFFAEAAAGVFKWSTNANDLHSHPFIGNVRVGYLTKNRLAYGIEYNHLIYKQPYSSRSPLQQGGSNWMNVGTTTDVYNSIGVFSEYRTKIGSRLQFVPGIFLHYLKNKYASKGETYQDGVPIGIPFERGTVYGYNARVGLSLTFNYTISSATAVTLRFLDLEHRFGKYDNTSFLAITTGVGIQYYFPTKSQQR